MPVAQSNCYGWITYFLHAAYERSFVGHSRLLPYHLPGERDTLPQDRSLIGTCDCNFPSNLAEGAVSAFLMLRALRFCAITAGLAERIAIFLIWQELLDL